MFVRVISWIVVSSNKQELGGIVSETQCAQLRPINHNLFGNQSGSHDIVFIPELPEKTCEKTK